MLVPLHLEQPSERAGNSGKKKNKLTEKVGEGGESFDDPEFVLRGGEGRLSGVGAAAWARECEEQERTREEWARDEGGFQARLRSLRCGAALQHTATRTATNTATRTATHCDTLQHTATRKRSACERSAREMKVAVRCGCACSGVVPHCNILQDTLQHTVTHCDTLQHESGVGAR